MSSLPENIFSVAAVRRIDRYAIDILGVSGYRLMQRAARAALQDTREAFPEATRWQILVGGGNNGGDGYVLARLAAATGIEVSVTTLVDTSDLSGDAKTSLDDFVAAGGLVQAWSGELGDGADLIVDAMLGVGLERDVAGDFAAAVKKVNDFDGAVVALDIPTGINGDSGAIMGCAVVADLTSSFLRLKPGLLIGAGKQHCGVLLFDDLGIDDDGDSSPSFRRTSESEFQRVLAPRRWDAHKGDFGHVLVIGGGPGMPGAARLCAEAALRAGAGRISVATHPSHTMAIAAARPELMVHGVADSAELKALTVGFDVLAFGPGLGQSEWARRLYDVIADNVLPSVWDADALNLLAKNEAFKAQRIITPHPGEAARLLGLRIADVQDDRCSAVTDLARRYGAIAVLKGAGTLVSDAEELPVLCTAGNPGMASPGMGDVLTGVIAALLAQGNSLMAAASIGVEVHARAADAAAVQGERGLSAGDVINELRAVVNL